MGAGLNVYVAVFLFRKNRVLLLERAPHKGFAPGRWTGVGGRVEPDEMANLEAAALRELGEEAGIEAEDVENLDIRVVLTRPEDGGVATVVFLTGHTDREALSPCSEGRLHWVALDRVDDLDLVENAGYALNLVLQADQSGFSGVYFAVEDATCGGAVSAVKVNRSALGRLPVQREIQ
jgi:8-oxo-dGTP diphosphatase